jgi:hypothetical protein
MEADLWEACRSSLSQAAAGMRVRNAFFSASYKENV